MPERAASRDGNKAVRGVIFDCDGVLIDSRNANLTYYNRLLLAANRAPMTPEQENFVHMASERQAIEHILPPEDVARYHELAAKVPYREVVLPLLRLEDGAGAVLARLRGRGLRLAVHTNRGTGMWDVLDKLGLRDMFAPVMTVAQVAPKPSPEGVLRILEAWSLPPSAVIFVGDSEADAASAQGAGVSLIAFKNAALRTAVAHVSGFGELETALCAATYIDTTH
jgi:phosphoglycolate phosphatase